MYELTFFLICQLVVKMHAFQKQMDFVVVFGSMYLTLMFLKHVVPFAYKFVLYLSTKCQRKGESITEFCGSFLCQLTWLFIGNPPNSGYDAEFDSNVDKLNSYIERTVPTSHFVQNFDKFDDAHFAQHGRVYLKLFEIVRSMKHRSRSAIIDGDQRRLECQRECLESVMANYRLLSPSQIVHASAEVSKLKSLF